MKSDQEFSPKYWVVHDKTTDDVFIDTARKNMDESIHAFICDHIWSKSVETLSYDKAEEYYQDSDELECILIEIYCLTQ